MLCSAHDTLDHRVLRFVSVHFFGPQMFRPPTTDLWHFEHVFLAPTHTQSESLMHPLSLPYVLVLREHLQKLPPRSLVGDAERDSREMGPFTPSINPGSIPAYVPGMGKAT